MFTDVDVFEFIFPSLDLFMYIVAIRTSRQSVNLDHVLFLLYVIFYKITHYICVKHIILISIVYAKFFDPLFGFFFIYIYFNIFFIFLSNFF